MAFLISIPLAIMLDTTARGESIFDVLSSKIIVKHHGGMPSLCLVSNGDLLLAHATNWQPIPPPGGSVKLLRSSDGGITWSIPEVIVKSQDPQKCSVHMWSGLHLMPDNSIILAYGQNFSESQAKAYLVHSLNHGKTWSDPVRLAQDKILFKGKKIDVPYTEGFGRAVTANNGDVLLPIGVRLEGGFYGTKASAFVRTTDNGRTWGPLEFIATGPEKFSETSLGVTTSGKILAIIRCDTTRRVLWQSFSNDHGRSWSKPTITKARQGARDYVHGKMPDILCLPTGRILLAVGSIDVGDGSEIWKGAHGSSYSGLYVSDDDGSTWKRDSLFPSAEPDNLIPYDSPVLAIGIDGRILALSVQYDRRTKSNPLAGWTMGSHLTLHIIR